MTANKEAVAMVTINVNPFLTTDTPDKALLCSDSTLEPLINRGDYVLIRSDCTLANGDFGIFYFNNEYHLRRYLVREKVTLLQSLSLDIPIVPYDRLRHKYYGKVVGIQRNLDK